jgi:hypothetical protein
MLSARAARRLGLIFHVDADPPAGKAIYSILIFAASTTDFQRFVSATT